MGGNLVYKVYLLSTHLKSVCGACMNRASRAEIWFTVYFPTKDIKCTISEDKNINQAGPARRRPLHQDDILLPSFQLRSVLTCRSLDTRWARDKSLVHRLAHRPYLTLLARVTTCKGRLLISRGNYHVVSGFSNCMNLQHVPHTSQPKRCES